MGLPNFAQDFKKIQLELRIYKLTCTKLQNVPTALCTCPKPLASPVIPWELKFENWLQNC